MSTKRRGPASAGLSVEDLSPFEAMADEDAAWLRELVRRANTRTLALSFSERRRDVERSPVASYDAERGTWWAGRFVGEVTFQGRTLTIEPRFGMPALHRWLSRIWGIRLLSSTGSYAPGQVWLWELMARLWSDRLVLAAKHGVPRVRVDEVHVGPTVRGRLLVPQSAASLGTGAQTLVSRTRNRRVDPTIGGVLLGAYGLLRRQLSHLGDPTRWLTERGAALVRELGQEVGHRAVEEACASRCPVRYTPITEGYRPTVELSQSLLNRRPSTTTADGDSEVYGVLLDMAEIWELYLFHLLRDSLADADVVHTGRPSEAAYWLLQGPGADNRLGAMKPDIVVTSPDRRHRLILDAKYKLTTPGPDRPAGVLRDDLYQLASYLSVAARPGEALDGGLVYPESEAVRALSGRGTFRLGRTAAAFSFFGVSCGEVPADGGLTGSECSFVHAVRRSIGELPAHLAGPGSP